jgi:putative membrane protein
MAVFCALLATCLLLRFGNAWALLPLLWLPWGVYASRQRAQREGYAVDERLVAVRGGWWSRWWRFAEIDKLQALRLERSPIDRRFGTATLRLDTAGASARVPLRLRFLPESEAEALYRQLGRKLASQRMRW